MTFDISKLTPDQCVTYLTRIGLLLDGKKAPPEPTFEQHQIALKEALNE